MFKAGSAEGGGNRSAFPACHNRSYPAALEVPGKHRERSAQCSTGLGAWGLAAGQTSAGAARRPLLAPPVAGGLLRPCPAEWLEAVPVSTRVISPRNDDESIIQPEGEPLGAQHALL